MLMFYIFEILFYFFMLLSTSASVCSSAVNSFHASKGLQMRWKKSQHTGEMKSSIRGWAVSLTQRKSSLIHLFILCLQWWESHFVLWLFSDLFLIWQETKSAERRAEFSLELNENKVIVTDKRSALFALPPIIISDTHSSEWFHWAPFFALSQTVIIVDLLAERVSLSASLLDGNQLVKIVDSTWIFWTKPVMLLWRDSPAGVWRWWAQKWRKKINKYTKNNIIISPE